MLSLIIILVARLCSARSAELPSFLHACSKNPEFDEQLQDCVSSQTKAVVEALKRGIPELDIRPIDPLVLDYMRMTLHDDFEFSFHNTTITGLSDCTFNRVLVNTTTNDLQLSVHYKNIAIVGDYKVQGFVFIIQTNSAGPVTMAFDDVILNIKLPLKTVERKLTRYLLFPRVFDAGLIFSTSSLEFENLFPTEPVLGTILNKFINDNFEDLYHVMRGGILDTVKQSIRNLFVKMFGDVPVEEIFTE